jgi:two-component system chemotaxis response regulator CheY
MLGASIPLRRERSMSGPDRNSSTLQALLSDQTKPVLVINDHALTRDLVASVLRKFGFDVDLASDGTEALLKLEERRYALIISDLNMEPIDGLQIVHAVRKQEEYRQTPFLLMTASMATEKVIAAKRAGVDAYILKPFTPQALMAKIQAALA